MQILSGRRHRVEELAFSHCGRWLAAGGRHGLHLWDAHDPGAGARHVPVNPAFTSARYLTFRPDGRLCWVASWTRSWYLTDPGSGSATRIAAHRSGTYAISPDAARAVRTYSLTPLRTYRIGDEKVTAGPTVSVPRTFFGQAAFTPDGTAFAVEEAAGLPPQPPRRVVLRAADTGRQTAVLAAAFADKPFWARKQYLFSPDGSRLVGRCEADLAGWAVTDPDRPPRTAAGPTGRDFLSMAFHPDGSLLTVDEDRLVRVWDADTLTPGRAIGWDVGKLWAVAVSPDGARAAVGSHTGKVLVWDWD